MNFMFFTCAPLKHILSCKLILIILFWCSIIILLVLKYFFDEISFFLCTEGLRIIICQELLKCFEGFDTTILEECMLNDTKLWKGENLTWELINCHSYIVRVFSSSTRNVIGLLVKLIQDALCIIHQLMHGEAGLSYMPLFTAFWVERAKHTCALCVFQNLHLMLMQCAQRRRTQTSE